MLFVHLVLELVALSWLAALTRGWWRLRCLLREIYRIRLEELELDSTADRCSLYRNRAGQVIIPPPLTPPRRRKPSE